MAKLTKKELQDIISQSEQKTSDRDIGGIAQKALERAKALLAELERSEKTANSSNNASQPTTNNTQRSNGGNGQRSNSTQNTANATPNSVAQNTANTTTTQSTSNTPQENSQQQPIGSVASTTDAGSGPYVMVDGKTMSIGEVKSKIITYLNHSISSQSVLANNWGIYIQRQTFRTLLFWIQTFAIFPRPSQQIFPTKEDIGDYFRSKDRKIIYELIKAAHEKEGDVTEIVQNIQNYLNQQN
jgi:hypothetical protein